MTNAERKLIAELKSEVERLNDNLEIGKQLTEIKTTLTEIEEELDPSEELVSLTNRIRAAKSKLLNVVTANTLTKEKKHGNK